MPNHHRPSCPRSDAATPGDYFWSLPRSFSQKIPLPGLPLNDHVWKFGAADKDGKVMLNPEGKVTASPMGLFNLINKGSPAESNGNNGARMQAWGQTLSPTEIAQVLSYVISKVPGDFAKIPKADAK